MILFVCIIKYKDRNGNVVVSDLYMKYKLFI